MSNTISNKVTQVTGSHLTSIILLLVVLVLIWLSNSGKLKNIQEILKSGAYSNNLTGGGEFDLSSGSSGGSVLTASSGTGGSANREKVIRDALQKAGFNSTGVDVMTAISKGESGMRSEATANTSKEYSVGPFQINLKAHPYISEAEARDPYTAAKWAYQLSGGGQNFRPWTVYTSGKYKQYLGK